MLFCYILYNEFLVKVDRLGVKVKGQSDRLGKVKDKEIENKLKF
jgi:hypothetical protein